MCSSDLADAQKYAQILVKTVESAKNLALKVELDPDKPTGLKAGEAGALVIPDKNLSAEKIAKAGAEFVPAGHLWMRHVGPSKNDRALPNSDLRTLTVTAGDSSADAQIYVLGIRKADGGKTEVALFGKGKEPVISVALEKATSSSEAPIQVEGRKTGDGSGILTLVFFGKQKAEIKVTKLDE